MRRSILEVSNSIQNLTVMIQDCNDILAGVASNLCVCARLIKTGKDRIKIIIFSRNRPLVSLSGQA